MQPPGFWQNPPEKPGLAARLLSPLAALWRLAGERRLARGEWLRLSVPVVCVGNINIGGTGKTPTVIALAERLKSWGWAPHVVSRGYGGSLHGPIKVVERRHKASEVGDEPLLLAAFCDTWVARDRAAGARTSIAAGADIILLDDGLQNPSLAKDLSLVVVDAVQGFGNGRIIPSGPLRERLEGGLARADAVLVIGATEARDRLVKRWPMVAKLSVVGAELRPLVTGVDWHGTRVLAFAGIGRPEKFFLTLKELGAEIVQAEALSDHQPLDRRLMQRLEADAFFKGAQMVTTEKDAVRLPDESRLRVVTLPVRLAPADWQAFDQVLADAGILPKHD